MPDQFDVKIIFEHFQPPFQGLFRLVFADVENQVGNFTAQAARQRDQVIRILLHQFFVYPRVQAVQTFHVAERTQPGKVVIAGLVFGDQKLCKSPVGIVFGEPELFPFFSHEDFAAYEGFNIMGQGLPYKFKCSVHVAVIRQCHGGHAHLFRRSDDALYIGCGLQNRILGMHVKMTERRRYVFLFCDRFSG